MFHIIIIILLIWSTHDFFLLANFQCLSKFHLCNSRLFLKYFNNIWYQGYISPVLTKLNLHYSLVYKVVLFYSPEAQLHYSRFCPTKVLIFFWYFWSAFIARSQCLRVTFSHPRDFRCFSSKKPFWSLPQPGRIWIYVLFFSSKFVI